MEDVRKDPYSLPASFQWSDLNLDNDEEVKEPEPPKEEVKAEEDKPQPKPKKASSSKKSSKPKPEPKKVEEEPPAPSAAAGEGQVIVNSRPWSNVKLGGKKLGRTGWKGKLPAGSHTLTLTTADGRSKRLKVVVRKDGTSMECWDFDADAKCPR